MELKYIETHAHLDHKQFKGKREELLKGIQNDTQLQYVINATIGQESMFNMRKMLSGCDKVLFTVGRHPTRAANTDINDMKAKKQIESFAKESRTVGIGETGIDLFKCTKDTIVPQIQWFRYFIRLSKDVNKPLIIHLRGKGAYRKALKVLKEEGSDVSGVFHCFNQSFHTYKKCIACGDFYFGIGGSLLLDRKNSKKLRKAVKKMSLERIVLETDCPFLKPLEYSEKFNEPFSIPLIIKEIANLKGIDEELVARITTENAIKLFHLQWKEGEL